LGKSNLEYSFQFCREPTFVHNGTFWRAKTDQRDKSIEIAKCDKGYFPTRLVGFALLNSVTTTVASGVPNKALKLRKMRRASSPRGSSPQRNLISERPRIELHRASGSPPSA